MPKLKRPDGVEIHWEARGEGPAVLFAPFWSGYPASFEALQGELAPDHRIVHYDPRGTGESTRSGPYDAATGTDDLIAVMEEAGGPAVVFSISDGANHAIRAADRRPDLVAVAVIAAASPLGRESLASADAGLASSDAVVDAFLLMVETDYRGALRTLMASNNPQMSEDEVRERVNLQEAYCPQEAAVARIRAWMEDVAADEARAIGDRLWGIHYPNQPWFGLDLMKLLQREFPEANFRVLPDGAVTRADLHADLIRKITSRIRHAEPQAT